MAALVVPRERVVASPERASRRSSASYDRPVTIEAEGHVTIRRTIEDVFDYLADPRNEPRWLPGAKAVTMTSDGEVKRGSTFVGEYQRAGRVELEIVEFQRPARVTFRARSKIVRFDDAVQLTPSDDGTRLDARMIANPQGPMRVVAPLMGRTMRMQFAANWDHLRMALER
jgi:carbon monoxide dehydrogenase subunit G